MSRIYGIFKDISIRNLEERLFQPWTASRIQNMLVRVVLVPFFFLTTLYVIIKLNLCSTGSWSPAFEIQHVFLLQSPPFLKTEPPVSYLLTPKLRNYPLFLPLLHPSIQSVTKSHWFCSQNRQWTHFSSSTLSQWRHHFILTGLSTLTPSQFILYTTESLLKTYICLRHLLSLSKSFHAFSLHVDFNLKSLSWPIRSYMI